MQLHSRPALRGPECSTPVNSCLVLEDSEQLWWDPGSGRQRTRACGDIVGKHSLVTRARDGRRPKLSLTSDLYEKTGP